MIQVTPQMRILVAIEPVDFRKGIDGLAQLCRNEYEENPFSGTVYVFRNRRRTTVKILIYDGQGFWLAQKRMSKERFKHWPNGREPLSAVQSHEFIILLRGGNLEKLETAPIWRQV